MLDGTGELPAGWAWARLSEICDLVGGVTVDAKRTGADLVEVPYLRVANVQRGRICLREVKTIRIPQTRIEQLRLASGDVLLNEGGDRDKVGRGWVWEGQVGDCVFQNHIFRARPRSPEVNPFYVSHYLNEIGRSYFLAGAKQTTNLASLSLSKVAEAPVMLAPPAEQTRIIAEVVRLFAELDEAEAALARARAGLAEYRASLLHAACTGQLTAAWRASRPPPAEDGPALLRRILAERRAAWERAELARLHGRGKPLTGDGWRARYQEPAGPDVKGLPELPDGWIWARLEQLCPVNTGTTPARGRAEFYENGTIPWITSAAVNDRVIVQAHQHITELALAETSARRNAANSLVVALYGEGRTRGKCARLSFEAATNQALAVLDTKALDETTRDFVQLCFDEAYLRLRAQAAGGVQPNLSLAIIKDWLIPLPPISEQQATLDAAEQPGMSDTDFVAQQELATLRQSILYTAFTGRLVPQDPADEPAAALLARLRAVPAPPRRIRPSAA